MWEDTNSEMYKFSIYTENMEHTNTHTYIQCNRYCIFLLIRFSYRQKNIHMLISVDFMITELERINSQLYNKSYNQINYLSKIRKKTYMIHLPALL